MSFEMHWNRIKPTFTQLRMWDRLHAFFFELESSLEDPLPEEQRITSNIQSLLSGMKKVPSAEWARFCSALDWTVYGAVALSWCEGAELDQVWGVWLASGLLLKPIPELERPARFLNPALVPQVETLSAIVNAYSGQFTDDPDLYALAISASIAAQKNSLKFDMTQESLANAPPQVAAFLKSRILQKSTQTPEDNDLIEAWDRLLLGTEWDIWNKEPV